MAKYCGICGRDVAARGAGKILKFQEVREVPSGYHSYVNSFGKKELKYCHRCAEVLHAKLVAQSERTQEEVERRGR